MTTLRTRARALGRAVALPAAAVLFVYLAGALVLGLSADTEYLSWPLFWRFSLFGAGCAAAVVVVSVRVGGAAVNPSAPAS